MGFGVCLSKRAGERAKGQSWGEDQLQAQPGMRGINLRMDAPSSCQVQLDSSASRAQLP